MGITGVSYLENDLLGGGGFERRVDDRDLLFAGEWQVRAPGGHALGPLSLHVESGADQWHTEVLL